MKVMKINSINNRINFKENFTNGTNTIDAGLMIQSKNGNVNFARDRYIAQQAYSVDSNPITSLGYKLYRTFGYFKKSETTEVPKNLNLIA